MCVINKGLLRLLVDWVRLFSPTSTFTTCLIGSYSSDIRVFAIITTPIIINIIYTMPALSIDPTRVIGTFKIRVSIISGT